MGSLQVPHMENFQENQGGVTVTLSIYNPSKPKGFFPLLQREKSLIRSGLKTPPDCIY